MVHARIAALFFVLAAVASLGATEMMYIPGVAQAKGVGTRYWNTELWISNTSSSDGAYSIVFLRADRDNADRLRDQGRRIELAAGATHHVTDAVPPESKGALKIVTSPGFVVTCRVFNATATGALGHVVPVLSTEEMVQPGATATLTPLLRSPRLRTNVGFFNPNIDPISVKVNVLDNRGARIGGASYTIAAGSQFQINDFLLAFRVERGDAHRAMISSTAVFATYASIVETRAGAPMVITPVVK